MAGGRGGPVAEGEGMDYRILYYLLSRCRYSMVSKRTAQGSQALLVVAGGGGGGSLDGLPGGGLEGALVHYYV